MPRCSMKLGSLSELKSPVFWRDMVSELISTTILLAFITLAAFVIYKEGFELTHTHFGLAIGFVVFILIETFAQFGGGLMNPAVTLLFVVRGQASVLKGFMYILVECLAGAAGSGLVYRLVKPEERDRFHAIKPEPELGPIRAVAVEILITAMLCLVTLAVTDPRRKSHYHMLGLPVGVAITTGLMTAGMSSGGAMNPIATFGPAVVAWDFEHHWVYWVGPMLGSALSLAVYLPMAIVEDKFSSSGGQAEPEEEDIDKESPADHEVTKFLKEDTNA